jgi:hypothetical protein
MSDDAKDSILLSTLPLDGYGQATRFICWYACYKMMYIWKGLTSYQLNKNLTDAGYDLQELSGRGLVPDEYGKICHAVGLVEVQTAAAAYWSISDVIFRLKRWGPIWVATDKFNGHAMVLYGAQTHRVADDKPGVTLADPYSPVTEGGPANAHNEYSSLDGFKQMIQPWNYSLQVFA